MVNSAHNCYFCGFPCDCSATTQAYCDGCHDCYQEDPLEEDDDDDWGV